MSFERARAIADAVLLEGYVLYPYRASALKNRFRFSFGVLAPRAWSEAGGCERWWLEAQCLVEGDERTRVNGRLRFLQLQRRTIEERRERGFRATSCLNVNGRSHVPWDEGQTHETDFGAELCRLLEGPTLVPFEAPAGCESDELSDEHGVVRGRVHKERWSTHGGVSLSCERVVAARPLMRVTVRVENRTGWEDRDAKREEVLRASCLSTHLLLAVSGGAFVSLHDPPAWAEQAAAACENVATWPVLAGDKGQRDLVLASPIILYDHPQIAPESPGDFFDATEIDELLTLRTQTLTDDEKREVRATDERTAALLDRVEGMPREVFDRLHGAVRELERIEDKSEGGAPPGIEVGARVVLRPGTRRTDAQDLLFEGRVAVVEKIEHDVDGRVFVSVTLEDDPAADLNRWYGRFHQYNIDEVELIDVSERRAG